MEHVLVFVFCDTCIDYRFLNLVLLFIFFSFFFWLSQEYLKILNHHFDLMKQILLPPYTRFLLWAMDQGDEFFKGGSQRNRGRIKAQSNTTSKVTAGGNNKGGKGSQSSGNAANLWPLGRWFGDNCSLKDLRSKLFSFSCFPFFLFECLWCKQCGMNWA